MRTSLAAALFAATTAMAAGNDRADLEARVERLGAHETATNRHAITLKDCRMTIFYWEDWGEHPKALHSVHHIDLASYWPLAERPERDKRGWFPIGNSTEVLMISMRPPSRLQSELALRSEPSRPHRPSPRQDLDQFVIRDRLFHGLRFDDLDRPGRMETLAALIDQYHLQFCRPTG